MIDILKDIEKNHILDLLKDQDKWEQGGNRVMRLSRPFGKYKIWIHKVRDFGKIKGQWHPHPWPMAVHVLEGDYYKEFGYSTNFKEPEVSARMIIPKGVYYEIIDKDMWHYITPVDMFCYTLMITAPEWPKEVLDTGLEKIGDHKPFIQIAQEQREELLDWFTQYYENLK